MDAIKKAFQVNPADQGKLQARDNDTADSDHLADVKDVTGLGSNGEQWDDLNPEARKELAQLRNTLQNNIQSSRMQHHAFEPLSLPGSQPASRVSTPLVPPLPAAITDYFCRL